MIKGNDKQPTSWIEKEREFIDLQEKFTKSVLQVRLELTTSASLQRLLPYKYHKLTDCTTRSHGPVKISISNMREDTVWCSVAPTPVLKFSVYHYDADDTSLTCFFPQKTSQSKSVSRTYLHHRHHHHHLHFNRTKIELLFSEPRNPFIAIFTVKFLPFLLLLLLLPWRLFIIRSHDWSCSLSLLIVTLCQSCFRWDQCLWLSRVPHFR